MIDSFIALVIWDTLPAIPKQYDWQFSLWECNSEDGRPSLRIHPLFLGSHIVAFKIMVVWVLFLSLLALLFPQKLDLVMRRKESKLSERYLPNLFKRTLISPS